MLATREVDIYIDRQGELEHVANRHALWPYILQEVWDLQDKNPEAIIKVFCPWEGELHIPFGK